MQSITIIENPIFEVSYKQQGFDGLDKDRPLLKQIEEVATKAFNNLKMCFTAVGRTISLNIIYIGVDIKEIIKYSYFMTLGPISLVFGGVLVVLVSIKIFVSICTGTIEEYKKMKDQQQDRLLKYSDVRIKISHLRSTNTKIKVKDIPNNIKVDSLIDIFNNINFNNPESPNYFNPEMIKDDSGNKIPIAALLENLKTFIKNINNKKAFIGTPLAGTPKLHRFYDQIKDGIRYCLYHTADPDTKARMIIDFSIAGKYCGARYMGEVMDAYSLVKGDETETTLQELLSQNLAKERLTLAKAQIQQHYAYRNGLINTHQYSAYMANTGRLLGLHGMDDVVEHLGNLGNNAFNTEEALRLYLQVYNRSFIMEKTATLLTSDKERNIAHEWFKDHAGSWNREADESLLREILEDADWKSLMDEKQIRQSHKVDTLKKFKDILNQIENNESFKELPQKDYSDIINEIFALKEVIAIFTGKQPERLQIRQKLLSPQFASECQALIGKKPAERKEYLDSQHFKNLGKAEAILSYLQKKDIATATTTTIMSMLKSPKKLEDYVKEQIEVTRRSEFLEKLHDDNGKLREEAIEWLLIEHKILTPPLTTNV